MTLDTKFLQEIDLAIQISKPGTMLCPDLDAKILGRINALPIERGQVYLRSEYIKYYFKAKQHYIEKHGEVI